MQTLYVELYDIAVFIVVVRVRVRVRVSIWDSRN
jgi:hypothetical protein